MEVVRSSPVTFTEEELKNEEWKVAPGFSRYEVSNLGRTRKINSGNIVPMTITYDGYYTYTITLDNEDDLNNINNSGCKSREVYIYDCITSSWVRYPSLISACYHTGVSMATITMYLLKSYGYAGGYIVAVKPLDNYIVNIPDTVIDDRDKLKAKRYKPIDVSYYVYDYLTAIEYSFKTIAEVVDYLNKQEPLEIKLTNENISSCVSNSRVYNRAMLLKGFGVKSSLSNVEWGERSKSSVLANKYGYDNKSDAYEVIVDDKIEYVFGNENLANRLNISHLFKNPRASIRRSVLHGSLDKLVSRSNIPNVTVRPLK